METIVLENARGDRVHVTNHGAHVTRFEPVSTTSSKSVLFVSDKAVLDGSKAIRGGIPICWPQFGKFGPGEMQHGFARNVLWNIDSVGSTVVEMSLGRVGDELLIKAGFQDKKFLVRVRVELTEDGMLKEAMWVKNSGVTPWVMTLALHSYFQIHGDIQKVKVLLGDGQGHYMDQLQDCKMCIDEGCVDTFGSEEIDRIYVQVGSQTIDIVDGDRLVRVTKSESLEDVVVWNPYIEKSWNRADFGDDEYKKMVCVECGKIANPVLLEPEQEYSCDMTIALISD